MLQAEWRPAEARGPCHWSVRQARRFAADVLDEISTVPGSAVDAPAHNSILIFFSWFSLSHGRIAVCSIHLFPRSLVRRGLGTVRAPSLRSAQASPSRAHPCSLVVSSSGTPNPFRARTRISHPSLAAPCNLHRHLHFSEPLVCACKNVVVDHEPGENPI